MRTMRVLTLIVVALQLPAANILLTQFDITQGYAEMKTNLESVGHTVTIVDATVAGNVAAELGTNAYNQVFLFDLTATNFLGGADISALADFWDAHRGLVVDSRSYGYYYQPNQTSEVNLLRNVASNLALAGGGVWVGTDHDPQWTLNGNPFLLAIGVDAVTGIYSDPVNYADPTSVLLSGVVPTDLWGGGQSIGRAPIGIQPNGIEMFIHFGNITGGNILPYISASFPLQGPVVPEPGTVALCALGLGALAVTKLRRAKRPRPSSSE